MYQIEKHTAEEANKKMIEHINNLRKWAFDTQNNAEKQRRIAKVEGYHEAYIDLIFKLGLQEIVFKKNIV